MSSAEKIYLKVQKFKNASKDDYKKNNHTGIHSSSPDLSLNLYRRPTRECCEISVLYINSFFESRILF